ncbi:MIF4G domain-containing protein isoform X2 [Centruroides vittatus]|uniref:MIF4G domain-containing protein isoform X2 n=1 Tax=Centruroides vittatus TaxID=120091 RepID=UPI00350FA5A3
MNQEARSPGLNMEHGFVKKIEHNQHLRQQQFKDDSVKRQEAAKLVRRVGFQNKTPKPSMELYRPPTSTEMTHKSGGNHRVHFQTTHSPKSVDLKMMLQRSKSFGGTDLMEVAAVGFERDSFPLEYHGIIKRALHDPNSLPSRQLMEVVRVICSKAVESLQNAQPAAQMCFTIIEKEKGNTFLESLLNSCREWYNEKDKLLRNPISGTNILVSGNGAGSKRWTAYVSFLMELYLRLKSHHRTVTLANNAESTGSNTTAQTPAAANQTLTLSVLIFECCQIILKPPSLNNVAEIECLRSLLSTIGRQLESDSLQRMQQIIALMRDAFIDPSISTQIRKTLLELVELHASQWQLDLPQTMYYFPYTTLDRN